MTINFHYDWPSQRKKKTNNMPSNQSREQRKIKDRSALCKSNNIYHAWPKRIRDPLPPNFLKIKKLRQRHQARQKISKSNKNPIKIHQRVLNKEKRKQYNALKKSS